MIYDMRRCVKRRPRRLLFEPLETREVLSLVMQKVSAVLKPANWSLLLLDEASGTLYFEIAVGNGAEKLRHLRVRPGEGIAGQVFVPFMSYN